MNAPTPPAGGGFDGDVDRVLGIIASTPTAPAGQLRPEYSDRDLADLRLLAAPGELPAPASVPVPVLSPGLWDAARGRQHERPGRLAWVTGVLAGIGLGGLLGVVLVEWWAPSAEPDPLGDWIVRVCMAVAGLALAVEVLLTWRERVHRLAYRRRRRGGAW